MDATAKSGRNPSVSTRFSLSVKNEEQADAGRDGVSRD